MRSANGCSEIPTKKITFHELGFCANFCETCANELKSPNVTMEEVIYNSQ